MTIKWTNWAGNVECQPSHYHEPTTEEALVALVKQVASKGERIKVVGAGHSCSKIAASDGVHLVSLQRYQQVLEVNHDARTVTVQAGIWLKELNDFLATEGLALSNMGVIAEQSIAGAISTATHGTGIRFGSLAQQVVALSLVTASGEVISASKEQNPDAFAAAQVSLGSLGILSTVTLLCEPAFNLHAIQDVSDLDSTLEKLDSLLEAEHFGFWWIPHTDYVRLWSAKRTNQRASDSQNKAWAWFNDILLGSYLHESALWLSSFVPSLVPTVNRVFRALLFNRQQEQIGRSDHVFTLTILMRQVIMEYGIPIEHTASALRELRDLIKRHNFKVHLPVDVRFTNAEDAWLSPAWGRKTCYIGILMYRPFGRDVPYEACFREIDALMSKFEGRPHWGKLHYRTASDLQQAYPHWDDFQKIRQELDPAGVFMNDYLERVFGSV